MPRMELAVFNLLTDIVSELHPAKQTGVNRWTLEIKHNAEQDRAFIYYGNKHNLYCEQVGRKIIISYITGWPSPFQIDLARPDSREIIANIFRTN